MTFDKPHLRAELMARRAELPAETRAGISSGLALHAPMIAELGQGDVVSSFWPIREEIDPRPLMKALHVLGVALALPVVTKEGLVFRRWQFGATLARAGFGLMQPEDTAEVVAPAVMLVPLLGFDRAGGRIGYGKGYYDGAIARFRPRETIGLAFGCQEVEAIPMEPHDQRLHHILTEAGLIDCHAGSRD